MNTSTDFLSLSLVKRLSKKRNIYRIGKSQYEILIRSLLVILAPAHLLASPSPYRFAMLRRCVQRAPSRFFPITRAKISLHTIISNLTKTKIFFEKISIDTEVLSIWDALTNNLNLYNIFPIVNKFINFRKRNEDKGFRISIKGFTSIYSQ